MGNHHLPDRRGFLFWQLGSLARTEAWRLRPILATFLVAYTIFAVDSYAYFFIGPVIAEVLIAACLGGALLTAGSRRLFSRVTAVPSA